MELNLKTYQIIMKWAWGFIIICCSCISSSSDKDLSNFSGASLVFETSKSDSALFQEIDWSDGTKIILQGRDIRFSRFPLYLVDTTLPGIVNPLIINYKTINGAKSALSPDAKYLAYWDSDEERNQIMNLEDEEQTPILLPSEFNGPLDWSADSQEVALLDLKMDGTLTMTIFSLNGEVQRTLKITDPRFQAYRHEFSFSWSSDGTRIAFSLIQRNMENRDQGDIFIATLSDNHVIQITNTPSWNEESVTWSPDNNRLIFVSTPTDSIPEVNGRLTLANADNSCIRTSSYPLGMTSVTWGPSKEHVAVTANGQVYILLIGSLGMDFEQNPLMCP